MFTTLIAKELKSLLFSPATYIFLAVMYGIASWMFFSDFFISNQATVVPFFKNLVFLMGFFLPAVTMGLVSEEKKNGTWEVLLTSGVSETQLILAKFIAVMQLFTISLLMTLPVVLANLFLGGIEVGLLVAAILGTLMIVAVYVAVGIFASSLTNSTVVGYVVAFGVLLLNNLLSQASVLARLPTQIRRIFESLSLVSVASEFFAGLFTLHSVLILASLVLIFITLAVTQLKLRNA